jgi:hypothetical protein
MGFEEPIEPVPGSKTEQPPQFRLGDTTALEFLERQGLERERSPPDAFMRLANSWESGR